MDFLITLFSFIVAIFILVTAHELGHFLTAKLFGMRVDKFYIGFDFGGKRLWKKKIGETEYGIGAFPLGGYVKIAGMIDESLDTNFQATEPQPWEFRAKPVWQRLIVLAGGVGMNFILATIIFIGVTVVRGEPRTSVNNPSYVEKGSVFDAMGMKTGDRFLLANGKPLQTWEEALDQQLLAVPSLNYTILRNGNRLTLTAPSDIIARIESDIKTRQSSGIRPITEPLIEKVVDDMPAKKAGIKSGSLITAINGNPVSDWQEVVGIISSHASNPIVITWQYLEQAKGRDITVATLRSEGKTFVTTLIPNEGGKIGISLKQAPATIFKKVNIADATLRGLNQSNKISFDIIQQFGKIFTGKVDARKSLGGPLAIAEMAKQSAKQGVFLEFLAILSINLAILNILPIPALDGGQFVLNAIEGITRREIPFTIKMRIQQVGMTLLLILFAYIILNDILHLLN